MSTIDNQQKTYKKNLTYVDFRTAAYRNLHVCQELYSRSLTSESRYKKQIFHKVYYLSGYIIEFCFKYSLFSNEKISQNQNLYEYENEDFRRKWKQHDFNKLRQLCEDRNILFSSDIPYFGSKVQDKKIEKLIKAWDVQIRYSLSLSNQHLNLLESEIKNLIDFIEIVLNKITSKYS